MRFSLALLVLRHGARHPGLRRTSGACSRGSAGGVKVTSIEIRGNKKIELPAIVGRLTLKAGDPYTPENVRGQIKILYDTGFFEDVQVETESTPRGDEAGLSGPRETVYHRDRLRWERRTK